jgi:hypothetical protein
LFHSHAYSWHFPSEFIGEVASAAKDFLPDLQTEILADDGYRFCEAAEL